MGGLNKCIICSKTKKDLVSLHTIPKDKRENWLYWLQAKEPVGKNPRVCSNHFRLVMLILTIYINIYACNQTLAKN